MPKGIIVFGASGAGTTTLGKELAQQLDYPHFDLDDYCWHWDTVVPFTVFRAREERIEMLMNAIEKRSAFILSGSLCGWDKPFVPLLRLGVFVTAPAALRAQRLNAREFERFGERILPGGDMHENHTRFVAWASQYDALEPPDRCLKLHEQWAQDLPCPVVRVDGTEDILLNARRVLEALMITGDHRPPLQSKQE